MRTRLQRVIAIALAATFTLAVVGCAGEEAPAEKTAESTDAGPAPAGD